MDTKHTPGPWSIHEWIDGGETGVTYKGIEKGIEKYVAPNIEHIFRIVADTEYLKNSNTFGSFEGCHIADLAIVFTSDGLSEAEANARLIAAAPEMLELLRQANNLLARSKRIIEKSGSVPHLIEGDLESLYWKIDDLMEERGLREPVTPVTK